MVIAPSDDRRRRAWTRRSGRNSERMNIERSTGLSRIPKPANGTDITCPTILWCNPLIPTFWSSASQPGETALRAHINLSPEGPQMVHVLRLLGNPACTAHWSVRANSTSKGGAADGGFHPLFTHARTLHVEGRLLRHPREELVRAVDSCEFHFNAY